MRCSRAARARPRNLTKNQRLAVIYNTFLRLAVLPRGPGPAHKSHKKSTISCLRCPRAARVRPRNRTKNQRLAVIYNTCLRFAVLPRGPGPAQKSHKKSTINCYLQYFPSHRLVKLCRRPLQCAHRADFLLTSLAWTSIYGTKTIHFGCHGEPPWPPRTKNHCFGYRFWPPGYRFFLPIQNRFCPELLWVGGAAPDNHAMYTNH